MVVVIKGAGSHIKPPCQRKYLLRLLLIELQTRMRKKKGGEPIRDSPHSLICVTRIPTNTPKQSFFHQDNQVLLSGADAPEEIARPRVLLDRYRRCAHNQTARK
jgi:hypothetical protein